MRIACRGGNWGMDDAMKRVARERLEPDFCLLHHDAHDKYSHRSGRQTEQSFYDLADEYGFLSGMTFGRRRTTTTSKPRTRDWSCKNAEDVIRRFRKPSIDRSLVRARQRWYRSRWSRTRALPS